MPKSRTRQSPLSDQRSRRATKRQLVKLHAKLKRQKALVWNRAERQWEQVGVMPILEGELASGSSPATGQEGGQV